MPDVPGGPCAPVRVDIVTFMCDTLPIRYCQKGGHLMAKSTSKTILFATTRFDKKVFNHPVAVFNTPSDAKTYATYLKLAYRAQDFDAIKALDPKAHVDSEGVPVPDAKLSLMEVPYAPVPLLDDDDTVEGDPAAS